MCALHALKSTHSVNCCVCQVYLSPLSTYIKVYIVYAFVYLLIQHVTPGPKCRKCSSMWAMKAFATDLPRAGVETRPRHLMAISKECWRPELLCPRGSQGAMLSRPLRDLCRLGLWIFPSSATGSSAFFRSQQFAVVRVGCCWNPVCSLSPPNLINI